MLTHHGGFLNLSWEWRLTDTLVLKLYPDVALFYGFLYVWALLALAANACAPLRHALAGQPRALRPLLRVMGIELLPNVARAC